MAKHVPLTALGLGTNQRTSMEGTASSGGPNVTGSGQSSVLSFRVVEDGAYVFFFWLFFP